MPELPEVETTRRGIAPVLTGLSVESVLVREPRLRWPVPEDLPARLAGRTLKSVHRRAKYLLFDFGDGWLLAHLGMSGSLRILTDDAPYKKHDHVEIVLGSGIRLRYHDPRRFGCLLWIPDDWRQHALIRELGPEPLSEDFDAAYLKAALGNRNVAIKLALMDNHVVVGVGNIYASESLFRARIHPDTPAGKLTGPQRTRLVAEVKAVLEAALESGGSTLRDYVNGSGEPGYFQQTLYVYDRTDQPCRVCGTPIRQMRQGQRSTFYCESCQRRK